MLNSKKVIVITIIIGILAFWGMTVSSFAVKGKVLISVPFTCQAPYANWDKHNESCEEAVAVMIHHFLQGTSLSKKEAEKEISQLKTWQVKNYGKESDLRLSTFAELVKEYYGYCIEIFEDITIHDIQKQLDLGRPVIVPALTTALGNPHFRPHPAYHTLIIKGYTPEGVIVNDAGTKWGESWFYSYEILFKAMKAQAQMMEQDRIMMAICTKMP